MKVGYAQSRITPELDHPVFLAGFGPNRRAQSVHDELYARVLVLHDNQHTFVLCALDLIGFFRPYAQEVIRRVQAACSQVQVIIACTHTHHGPDTMGLWGPNSFTSGVDLNYLEHLKNQLVETILRAVNNQAIEVAAIKAVEVRVPGVAKNARNPEIIDDALAIIQFLNSSGENIATLLDFPCHPEVLWEKNPHITADYPGVLCNAIESATGAPCLFFAGALGGMMTPDVVEHSFQEAEIMGMKLAQTALEVLKLTSYNTRIQVSMHTIELMIPMDNILFKLAFWQKLLPDVRDQHGLVHTEVNLLKLGPAWLISVPGELLPALGIEIKKRLRRSGATLAVVIGLANDELGYILPEGDYRYPLNPFRPGNHYEETMSPGREAGTRVMHAVDRLLANEASRSKGQPYA